jgi:hypothetical protein
MKQETGSAEALPVSSRRVSSHNCWKRTGEPDYSGGDHLPNGGTGGDWLRFTRWSSEPPSGQPPPGSQNVDHTKLDHLLSLVT